MATLLLPIPAAVRVNGSYGSVRASSPAVCGPQRKLAARAFVLLGKLSTCRTTPRRPQLVPVAAASTEAAADFRKKEAKDVVVFGATGYIGKFVTNELVKRGYNVTAFARDKSAGGRIDDIQKAVPGAKLVCGSVMDDASVRTAFRAGRPDVVVSCLASRSGGVEDSWAIDYTATKRTLDAAIEAGAQHYVLLSAICVQKPLLEFQRAKLKLEADLAASGLSYSIVRPTAFFKSLGGQIESVKSGGPYVMFGDGQLAACKPISEADLAAFIADCCLQPGLANRVLPIGGPGEAMTALQQGKLLFKLLGKEEKFIKVPIEFMDSIIGLIEFLGKFIPGLADKAEFGRIGRYYAAESMLVWDPKTSRYVAEATPSYGKDTLEAFFSKVIREGMAGQELGDAAVWGQK